MNNNSKKKRKRSIFKAIFVPVIIIMIVQSALFYITAVYGGIEKSLNQNAVDIMKERLTNEKNEIENLFNKDWTNLDECQNTLNEMYVGYQSKYGNKPFTEGNEAQIEFLSEAKDLLIRTLRQNQVNGVFLILNDKSHKEVYSDDNKTKYGFGIRDLDVTSSYIDKEDLLIERAPVKLTEQTGCSLDSWWEANYNFNSMEDGAYYYNPINAAWDNKGVDGENIAFYCGGHQVSDGDNTVISYSLPLLDKNGDPYAVLGIELTSKYLTSLLRSEDLGNSGKACYVLADKLSSSNECTPIAHNGVLFNSSFGNKDLISCGNESTTGGFDITARNDKILYGELETLEIYNNNNPFEANELVLIAIVDKETLFFYSTTIKERLLIVAVISLIIGVLGILAVSKIFATPITKLAKKARNVQATDDYHLEHLGITEIDQLVDSIENLGENVNKQSARTDFFSRMSHDMRTPMNAIISFSSEEMLEDADEAVKNEYLEKIHGAGEYLLGLINEVLDMTKIESNTVDLNYENMSAGDISKTAIPIVEKLAEEKKIVFEKEISIPENLYIKADVQHINQIIINLLSNAIKFTPENKTVSLSIIIDNNEINSASLLLVVRDEGIGMSKEFMEKLYTPFEQENPGKGGTGLGLSICKKLVTLMHGTIDCQSEKNKGTEFTVKLQLEKCEKKEAIKNKQSVDIIRETKTKQLNKNKEEILVGKKVLLCEDHPLNTQIAVKLLKKKGMIVTTAENGRIGYGIFEKSEEGYFDIVIMDIRMPVMDGLEATRCIRKLDIEDVKRIPIIAMKENAFEDDIRESRSAGMNAHLSKPIEPQKLYGTLEKLLCQTS